MKTSLRKTLSVPKGVLAAAFTGIVIGCVIMLLAQWLLGLNSLLGLNHVAFSDEELAAARRATQNASASLDRYLGYGSNGQGWRRYLRYDELQRQLADGQSGDQVDLALLTKVVERLSENHDGLQLKQFVNLRTSLSSYVKMLKSR